MRHYGDQLLLAILTKSFGLDGLGSVEQFMDAHPALTETAYNTLRFLGYVEPDHSSSFGFGPTHALTHQLLEPSPCDCEKQHPDEDDRHFLNELIQASGAPMLWEGGMGLSNLLVVLRLAYWSEDHVLIPTEWMHMEVLRTGKSSWLEKP
jgi:hypothetical protein